MKVMHYRINECYSGRAMNKQMSMPSKQSKTSNVNKGIKECKAMTT